MVGRLAALCLRHRVFGKWQVGRRGQSLWARGRNLCAQEARSRGLRHGAKEAPLVNVGRGKYSGRN